MQIPDEIGMAATGAFAGIVTALVGYFKSVNTKDPKKFREEFKASKFVPTIVLGAIIGAVAGFLGMTYDDSASMLATTGILGGITALVENAFKAVSRTVAR